MIKTGLKYFLIITVILYSVRYLHYKGLLKQKQGYYAKYNTAFLNSNSFDVLFLGSSRVQMHYTTQLFDSLTQANSFNLSLAGATPKVAFSALKIYLSKSKAPKLLFYDVDYHNLNNESKEVKDFSNFFPYLNDKTVRSEFTKLDKRMYFFYLFPYYSLPYTSIKNINTGINGWLNRLNKTDTLFNKGYFKEVLRPSLNFNTAIAQHIEINTTELNYLDSICKLCAKNKIALHLVSSPLFAGGVLNVKNKNQVIAQLKQFAITRHINYTDLSSLPFCNQRFLFVDHFHMNYQGAALFTAKFAHFYSNILYKNTFKH